jgi:hypothetical protein
MNWKSITLFSIIIILLGSSACSPQLSGTVLANAVDTAVAQTMAAQTSIASVVESTLAAVATNTPESTFTPSLTPTPSLIPTSPLPPIPTFTLNTAVPMVSVSVNMYCRAGPGKVYDLLGVLAAGQTAEVVARDAQGQNWLIRNPSNPTGVCWLWGYYAIVTGDTSGLPIATPQPTPTPVPGSGYTVSFLGSTNCAPRYAFRFQVKNTGTITWESIQIVVTDNLTVATMTHALDAFRSYNGCSLEINQNDLMPGESGVVANIDPGQFAYNPAGHSITAIFTLCSQNGLAGTCLSKTINFTP